MEVLAIFIWYSSALLTSIFRGMQVLAAHRYGIKRVILPERNLKDLTEVPSPILSGMEVCGCIVACLRLLRPPVCCSFANVVLIVDTKLLTLTCVKVHFSHTCVYVVLLSTD